MNNFFCTAVKLLWFSNFPAQTQCQNSIHKNKNNSKITAIILFWKSSKCLFHFFFYHQKIVWTFGTCTKGWLYGWREAFVSDQVYVTLEIHKREVYLYATNSVGFLNSSQKILYHVLLATCHCNCCIQYSYKVVNSLNSLH